MVVLLRRKLLKELKVLPKKEWYQVSNRDDDFENLLEETDFGFIVDKEGNLKALWIPEGQNEDSVPEEIVKLIVYCFGLDPRDKDNFGTIH
jgi:hypothetical protein